MNTACWRPPQRPVILAHFVPRGDDLALAYFSTLHLALSPPPGNMVCVATSTAELQVSVSALAVQTAARGWSERWLGSRLALGGLKG